MAGLSIFVEGIYDSIVVDFEAKIEVFLADLVASNERLDFDDIFEVVFWVGFFLVKTELRFLFISSRKTLTGAHYRYEKSRCMNKERVLKTKGV